jgi:hypothetical protein
VADWWSSPVQTKNATDWGQLGEAYSPSANRRAYRGVLSGLKRFNESTRRGSLEKEPI